MRKKGGENEWGMRTTSKKIRHVPSLTKRVCVIRAFRNRGHSGFGIESDN